MSHYDNNDEYTRFNNGRFMGLKDADGTELISLDQKFQTIDMFVDGVAIATQIPDPKKAGVWGLIDKNGNPVSEMKYGYVKDMGGGYYLCEIGAKRNLLRRDGTEVLEEWCHDIYDVEGQYFLFGNTLRKSKTNPKTRYMKGLANVSGEIIFPPIFEKVRWANEEHYALTAELEGQPLVLYVDGGIADPSGAHLPSNYKDPNLTGAPMHITMPDNLQRLKSLPEDPQDLVVYGMQTQQAMCIVKVQPVGSEDLMPFDDNQSVIDGIHQCLEENQGLIEVNNGKTKRGLSYVYSIVKSMKQPHGVTYFLTMHISNYGQAISIRGDFDEIGTTGIRDANVFEFCRQKGYVTFDEANRKYKGWTQDPYDDNYTTGALMNLSEDSAFDEAFPDHPLSQLRKAIAFIINNN